MSGPSVQWLFPRGLSTFATIAILATTACAPQAAAPTTAPAKAAPTVAPAPPAPTAAAAKPAATTAPAKTAATAAPAAKPTEKPAAKAAEFDAKAVADFYKGKTVRIIVGFGPGGLTDTNARLLQKVMPRYIPGEPTIVVENRPGGGSLLAANTVSNSEPKDGTAIAAIDGTVVLQQAIGGPGVQFDAGKVNWLGSMFDSPGACAVRPDAGINSVQDIMAGGKELAVASYGKGGTSYNPPAVMNAVLGTRFKIVLGYESGAAQRLAVRNNEAQGFCSSFADFTGQARELLEGPNPVTRVLIVMGDKTPDHPFLKGVPAAETLARTDEGKALLRASHAPLRVQLPHLVAPEVPRDRVQALRRALDKSYADAEFRAAAEKAQLTLSPYTGEEVTRIFQELLGTSPAALAKLKQILE